MTNSIITRFFPGNTLLYHCEELGFFFPLFNMRIYFHHQYLLGFFCSTFFHLKFKSNPVLSLFMSVLLSDISSKQNKKRLFNLIQFNSIELKSHFSLKMSSSKISNKKWNRMQKNSVGTWKKVKHWSIICILFVFYWQKKGPTIRCCNNTLNIRNTNGEYLSKYKMWNGILWPGLN